METKTRKRGTRRPKADTGQVLGDVAANNEVDPKWERHYRNLSELHSILLNRQADLVKDAREEQSTFSLHIADAATDNYDRDFALSMISAEQDALYEIEQALSRIKNGTYGRCEVTGKAIEPARLTAIPWTRFSAEAEKDLEKSHAVSHTQLGRRESVPRSDTSSQVAGEVE